MATSGYSRGRRSHRRTEEADDIAEEPPIQIRDDENSLGGDEDENEDDEEEDEPRGPGDMRRKANGRIPVGNLQVSSRKRRHYEVVYNPSRFLFCTD